MRKSTNLLIAIGAGLCFGATAQADDLRFNTLPPTVQTTVIRETRIPNASSVTLLPEKKDTTRENKKADSLRELPRRPAELSITIVYAHKCLL